MEIIKEWWAAITALIAAIFWIGSLHKDVHDLKQAPPAMTVDSCNHKMSGCTAANLVRFQNSSDQFREVKEAIIRNDEAGQARHSEIMKILLEMNR